MAKKKRVARPVKKTRNPAAKKVSAKKPPSKSLTLGQQVRHADLLVRRTAQEMVEKATELEAARIAQRELDRKLAAIAAENAKRAGNPFYSFLAQGDSWFSYVCGYSLIHHLKAMFGSEHAYFDNIASSGRLLRQMLSREFKDELVAGPPNGQPWTAVLLSGGGNDICGDHRFRDWLKSYDGGAHAPEWYITDAFDRELAILLVICEEIIDLVGNAPGSPRVFAHGYDFAIPDGRCVTGRSPHLERNFHFCFAGPWMWPAFEERGYHRRGDPISQLSKDIVTAILKRYADKLAGLEQKYPNRFNLVRTQGTLQPIQAEELWDNELHPYDSSFKILAKPFYDKLRGFVTS